MATFRLQVNGKTNNVDVEPDTPLLWVLRDNLNLLGAKYGCGQGICGACTVLMDGKPVRSCTYPVSQVGTKKVATVEGLSANGSHPVQKAWIEEDVPQCGYCHSGQIMGAVALLAAKKNPTDSDIDEALRDNYCRCGTYPRIRKAIRRAAKEMQTK